MKTFVDQIPTIIKAAATSPLGIVALVIIAVAIVAVWFFQKSRDKRKFAVFLLFLGFAVFTVVFVVEALQQAPQTQKEAVVTSIGAEKADGANQKLETDSADTRSPQRPAGIRLDHGATGNFSKDSRITVNGDADAITADHQSSVNMNGTTIVLNPQGDPSGRASTQQQESKVPGQSTTGNNNVIAPGKQKSVIVKVTRTAALASPSEQNRVQIVYHNFGEAETSATMRAFYAGKDEVPRIEPYVATFLMKPGADKTVSFMSLPDRVFNDPEVQFVLNIQYMSGTKAITYLFKGSINRELRALNVVKEERTEK